MNKIRNALKPSFTYFILNSLLYAFALKLLEKFPSLHSLWKLVLVVVGCFSFKNHFFEKFKIRRHFQRDFILMAHLIWQLFSAPNF